MRNTRTHIKVGCKICSKEFGTTQDRVDNGRGKYCSRKCYSVACTQRQGYWKGKTRSTPWMVGESNTFFGKKPWNTGLKLPEMSGENHPNWVKDRTKLSTDRRHAYDGRYKDWMSKIRLRDNWKCKMSNKDCLGRIETHHILSWREHPELRYELNNGITLCHFHHPRAFSEEKRLVSVFQDIISETSVCQFNGTDWKTTWASAI